MSTRSRRGPSPEPRASSSGSFPPLERDRPIISVHDGASHSLAWLGSALGVRQSALGVDSFGESGTIEDLHEITGISQSSIINAAIIAVNDV